MSLFDDLLEKTCKNMIKTILFCLEDATKGTVYRIGSMPGLQATRVTSGKRVVGSDDIQWGLPSVSDYNPPGKSWEQYRDRPDHVLEAMGWCVEKQKSWTADNPFEDVRSVGKQLRGEIEDFYHMEPVLVRKVDLYGSHVGMLQYPLDWWGNPIWQDTEYVVAAVLKIHFKPYALLRDDRSTKIIQELSRSLGTELLSLNLRESLARAQKEFTRQRLHSCEILAHELRNALIRFAFIFSAVNAEIGILRGEWEKEMKRAFPHLDWKDSLLVRLNELVRLRLPVLVENQSEIAEACKTLLADQEELASRPLLPSQAEQWLSNKILPKWKRLLTAPNLWNGDREEIEGLLQRLSKAVALGADEKLAKEAVHLPEALRDKWFRLAYLHFSADKLSALNEILDLLEEPALPVSYKHQIAKVFKSLKVLIEAVPEIEERANRIILSLRYGADPDQLPAAEYDLSGGGVGSMDDRAETAYQYRMLVE